jgi:hypothetical protein
LGRLRECNISLNLSKCAFAKKEVDYLGYPLSSDGIKPQQRLTDAIRNFPMPNDRKAFLCVSNYYRDFIPMYADVCSPLTTLTSDKVPFKWSEECDALFATLKDMLSSYPVLAFPSSPDLANRLLWR